MSAFYELVAGCSNPLLSVYRGIFSVTQICSRTRDCPACVAPAKNNFICVSIVKREKRMRSAVRDVTPLRSIRMRELAYNFSAHFRVGRGARTVLY
jgi:hypothetical protein